MLHSRRVASLRARWEVRGDDGEPLTALERSGWRGVRYTLDDSVYEVLPAWTGRRYSLSSGERELAHAERVGRKHWTVSTPDGEYHFRRRSIWKSDQEWVSSPDAPSALGGIRRAGFRRGAEADLPGLPTPLAVFVLAVVLLMWEQAAAAAASGAGGGGG